MRKFKTIYCDFDGTITKKDTLTSFFEKYAQSAWLEIEEIWRQGKITSKECLERQLALVCKISAEDLHNYAKSIEIDDYFPEFYEKLKSRNMKLVILSDGLDLFIEKTLEKYNLSEIPYFSNSLVFTEGKLTVKFNNLNPSCESGSGTCKCSKVQDLPLCYIGDGLSDRCIAKKAQLLFAKGSLKKYCDENKIKYIKFETFKDILNFNELNDT